MGHSNEELENGVAQIATATEAPRERLAENFDSLKENFVQLRNDLSHMITNAFATGSSGKDVAGAEAKHLFDQARDKIRDNPGTSALIAFGVGYIAAKMLRHR